MIGEEDIECNECGHVNENRGVDGRSGLISGGPCDGCGAELNFSEYFG